ncbi:MAG: hypothetical protein DRP06_00320 [Candidatus Aenigmatarchaeota archaeon]|nr:MAG: hypothetical protein DRP06_00320 [Candidatus Aenigmarchaeota archaeon]
MFFELQMKMLDHILKNCLNVKKDWQMVFSVNENCDSILNITKKLHEKNLRKFKKRNNCKQPINLSQMGDFEITGSYGFETGYEKIWLSTTEYINLKGCGI